MTMRAAERAPLIAPGASSIECIDVECIRREETQSHASPSTSAWSRVGRVAGAVVVASVAFAGSVAVVAHARAPVVASMPQLPQLGGTSEWRRMVSRGEVSRNDLNMAANVPVKTCSATPLTNDANDYFIKKTIDALPDLAARLGTRGGDFPHSYDHHEVVAGFMTGTKNAREESPYALPSGGYVKEIKQHGDRAMVYHFVHIPKAGGTYFNEVLTNVMRSLNNKFGSATPGAGAGGVYANWITNPLLDATAHGVFQTTHYMLNKSAPFGTAKLARDYALGRRMFSKGSFNMGLCSATYAPCMYLTVLRNPFDRFMSHYKYSCLEGAEERALWLPEWKAKGECPLDPLQWFQYTQGDDWTHLLAPGAYPRDSECHVETVKANLKSGCMRYLLTEKLADGLTKMRNHLPDFAGLNVNSAKSLFTNESASRLTPALKARLDRYTSDKDMMDRIKKNMIHQFKVYEHAVENYEAQWKRPLETC